MKWGVKKYCPLFSCCSADDAVRPVVQRVNRSIGATKRPPKQKQGLLDLLSSYQLAKNDPHAEMGEWAMPWAASGTLLHLARIAFRLGTRVETSSMELVCLNAALIVAYLPEDTPYLRDFLDCTMQLLVRPAKRSPLGVYRLLLVLLRFESLRREASASGFVEKLHDHYHRIVFLSPSSEQSVENEESSVEDSDNDESSLEEEIIDDLFEDEPSGGDGIVVSDSQPVGVVPRLNFAWLKTVPAHDSATRRNDRSLSIEKSVRTEVVTTISDRSSPGTSERFRKAKSCTEQSTPIEGRSLQRIKNLFRPRRGDGDDAMNGVGHVLHCLGLSETISLLGNLNDTYFTQKYDDVPYPVQEWRLTPFLKEKNRPQDREELAMLEVFLNVASENQHPPAASIRLEIMKSVVSDILKHIHTDTVNHKYLSRVYNAERADEGWLLLLSSVLEHCIAVYVEYSVPLLVEKSKQDAPCARLVSDTNTQEADDTLLEMLVKEIHKIASLRRPGEGVFHKLNLLLMVTAEYLRKSPVPTEIANNLVFTLNSAQKTYIKSAGHVLQWTETHVQAFRCLLSFYESIFKKCMSVKDRILFEKLVIQTMDETWKGLVRGFCDAILFRQPFPWLNPTERDQIIAEILLYFTSLMKGFACFNNAQQSMQGGYLDDFDFLLVPKFGLATVILDASDVATLVQEQVLRFIMTSCSLTRTTFIADTVMIESYLKLIITRLLELWQKTSIGETENASLMTLYLQAITAVMRCCSCSGLTLVLSSGIVGLLVNEINMTSLDETSPGVRVHPCYTVSSRPSSSGDSHRQSDAAPRTEPVEVFQMCHSLSDVEGEESLVPTFNSDLPFQTQGEVFEERPYVSSSSSGTIVFNAPHVDLDDDTFGNDQRLFFGEKTVDQVENELFGDHSIQASVESEEYTEDSEDDDDEWPSELSVHGDIEEDGRRWERYQTQKKFQNGHISFEEMQNRLAALSTTSATEDDDPEPLAPIPSCTVPVLDFDRLKSGHSEGASALISEAAPSHGGESPSVVHPANHLLESGKQQIESAVSPLELSPVHQRNGSMLSCGASAEPTGRLVHEDDAHLAAVEFLIELLLLLDRYDDQSTVRSSDLVASISSGLYHDLNGSHFVPLKPELLRRIQDRGADALRMLRLFLEDLFEVEQYETLDRIHKGEMAHVKRCALKRSGTCGSLRIPAREMDSVVDDVGKDLPETCVVKVINLPREILRSDASILSIYSEISLMERLSHESGFCQIYDYGVRSDSAYIVMQDCRCSLRDWVERFPVSSSWAIRLILKIFVRIAKSVHRLHQKVIVHFDLKCSNILLKGGPSNEGFWFPNNENPDFDILLADFGVARCYEGQDQLGTVRNRGTEYSKAPEMLLLTNMPQKSVRNYDRRRVKGVGTSSDVWALGCLLFELLTGEMLHFDRDWARFYTRVTQEVLPLFDDDKVKLLHLSYRSAILELLRFILVRDPQRRPTVAAIIDRVEQLLDSNVLPRYRPPFTTHRLLQIPSMSMPRAFERVPHTEWLCRLLSGDLHFTLYLTKLRLSVTILDGNLHSPQFLQFMEFMNASLLSGILYIENTPPNQKSNFARGFVSRIKGFCSRRQTEILFVPLIFSGRRAILHEIKCTVNRWCRYKSPEWTLSLTTARHSALPFLDVLLDIIMTIEDCPCLKAISILKARVKGG